MTTFTSSTTIVDALSTTSFSQDAIFNYDMTWEQAYQGSRAAINALIGEFERRLNFINPGNTQLTGYQHFTNRTALRKQVMNYRAMIEMLQQVLNKRQPLSSLLMIKNNHALVQPHFGPFTRLDLEMITIGMSRNGSKNKYRGIENFSHLENYATFSAHENGILVTLNGEQYIIDTNTAYALIAAPLQRDLDAKEDIDLLRKAGSETPEAIEVLEAQFCHFQRIAYTQSCVFPTNGNTISYDGCTMIIPEGTEFLTSDGQVVTLETTRLSMEHWLYTMLIAPVAQARGLSKTEKFQHHAALATELFGENTLGCNETELRQLWDYALALVKGENDTYRLKTKEEIEACFMPGRYHTIRHFTCPQDIKNIDTYVECMAAYEQDQIDREAERVQKRENKQQQAPATNDYIDDNPFGN